MKKLFPYILIVSIIVQLFAPFSVGLGVKNNLEVVSNKAEAEYTCVINDGYFTDPYPKYPQPTPHNQRPPTVTYNLKTTGCQGNYVFVQILALGNGNNDVHLSSGKKILSANFSLTFNTGENECDSPECNKIRFIVGIKNNNNEFVADAYPSETFLSFDCDNQTCSDEKKWGFTSGVGVEDTVVDVYFFEMKKEDGTIEQSENFISIQECQVARTEANNNKPSGVISVGECTNQKTQQTIQLLAAKAKAAKSDLPVCSDGVMGLNIHVGGCIAQGIYYLFFKTTSLVFGLTGRILDFTIMYSIKDTSYRSPFVVEGWGLIRDFCNMFFIFVLLYIAFGTILGLHSVKTKEMIINVVIIGLLINFSLFATQVIIDASNILTRVFYNSNTIVTGSEQKNADGSTMIDSNGDPIIKNEVGDFGEIQLSAAIVNKVNPVELITSGSQVEKIPIRGTLNGEEVETTEAGLSTGTFIIVTLLATVINVIGMVAFLSSALIFIARVIGLWLAMILAPLAFFSYTVPALQDMKMIGWKKWWPETLKLAFLAPVFVFFMYLIVGFLGKGLGIISASMKTTSTASGSLSFLIAIIVPFVFIMILLMKAKDLAKDMSGEIGQTITKGIAAVGGVALGAATGGAALLGRASLGRVANKIGNSNWLNDAAAGKKGRIAQTFGKMGKSATNYTAKSSFDFRQTKAGNAFTKETGMNLDTGTNFVGLDTKKGLGGYAGAQQRKVEEENKFGETLGYNHHKYEEVGDEIAEQESDLAKYKASDIDHNSSEYKGNVAKREYDIAGKKKEQERIKSGRAKEYALTNKRKSGKIYDIDKFKNVTEEAVQDLENKYNNETDPQKKEKARVEYEKAFNAHADPNIYRDTNGNIKKFGHAENDGKQAVKQVMKEFVKGMAQGATTGAIAGSIIPGVGTVGGLIGGGLIGGVRSAVINYSGTSNRKVGEESHGDKHETKNNYNPVAPSAPKTDNHSSSNSSTHEASHH